MPPKNSNLPKYTVLKRNSLKFGYILPNRLKFYVNIVFPFVTLTPHTSSHIPAALLQVFYSSNFKAMTVEVEVEVQEGRELADEHNMTDIN